MDRAENFPRCEGQQIGRTGLQFNAECLIGEIDVLPSDKYRDLLYPAASIASTSHSTS